MFLQSRRDDPTIKDRENALQSLDLAYHKYREINRHLDEGLQVKHFSSPPRATLIIICILVL